MAVDELVTVTEIAESLKVSRGKVQYLLLKSGIVPVHRAGLTGLYNEGQVEALRRSLQNLRGFQLREAVGAVGSTP